MKTTSTTRLLLAAAVIAGAFATGFATGPAFADDQRKSEMIPFDFSFFYAADELESTPKAEKMLKRLERKVRTHCARDYKMTISQRERELVQICIDETMKTSIAKFRSEAVAQAYKTRADG
jgi:methyltransferase-like protein